MTELRDRLQSTLGTAYTLDRELGGGGMSRVFVAEEVSLGRKVVVKVLSPELAAGISVDRFKREIQMAARLQQANIVPVLAAGETDGLPYYTMPFAEGLSLRDKLKESGALPLRSAVNVIRDMSRALAYAHEHGVVHRDIKPENVLLSGGAAVVTDFGIAKALSASREAGGASGGTLTQAGTSLGTPAYMAPEQVAGDPNVDHRADIYALGCVAYELLAGQPPFHGQPPQRLLAAHLTERPKPVEQVRADVAPALAALVMRCLEKDPTLRPQSGAEVLEALEGAVSTGSGELSPEAAILLRRRISLARALGLYAMAAIAVPIVAKAAVIAIGLPDWVFPGSIVIVALGLPVILATYFVQRTARKVALTTPTLTPGGSPTHSTMTSLAMKAHPHMTWRRAAIGGAVAVGVFALIVAGYMAMRLLGIGPAASLMAAGVLGERERIIVADFKSPANDSTLGPVVTEAVRADLSQSSNLNVMQASAVREALQRMQRRADTRVDFDLARELATREGVKAVLDGEILALGGSYVLTAKLIATQSGEVLASFNETANASTDMLPALGRLAKSVRAKVGESLRSVQKAPPLEQVTTGSLEALRKYVAGSRAYDNEGNTVKGLELLREAVAIDSTFASAWRKMAAVLANAGMPRDQIDTAATRAYRYRDRLSFVERQMAMAYYFDQVVVDRRRAIEAYEAIVERDSMNQAPYNNLAVALSTRREFARAEQMLKRRHAVGSPIWQSYAGLVGALIDQGKFDEAERTWDEWRKSRPGPQALSAHFNMLYARGQLDSAERHMEGLRSHQAAQTRVVAANALASVAMLRGQLAKSRRLLLEGRVENRARTGNPGTVLDDSLLAIRFDVWFLDRQADAARRLDALLARTPLRSLPIDRRPYFGVANLYAFSGRPDRSRAIIAEHDAAITDSVLFRQRSLARHYSLGEIALAEKRPADALKEFVLADRLPDGPANGCSICPMLLAARAYDLGSQPDSAIAGYERFLSTPMYARQVQDQWYRAGSHKRLGELYEAKGERQKALGHYLKFVELWKNADPELQPKVAEARAKIARLRDTEGSK
jgi:tetratricopeptide (TPR) repeat protein/tRNA A-37 threonylcarbamoyl transferase component Bud32